MNSLRAWIRDSIAQTARAAPQVARQEIQREGRAYFRGAVVASVVTSLLIGVPLMLLNRRIAENTAEDQVRATQFQAASQDIRQLAQGAYDLGVVANAELSRRGLATVSIPTPGTASDSAVLSAAATAQAVARIPPFGFELRLRRAGIAGSACLDPNRSSAANEPFHARRRIASSLVGRVEGPDLSLLTGLPDSSAIRAPSGEFALGGG